jgi:hypothetical protein
MDANFTFDDCNFYFIKGAGLEVSSPGNVEIINSDLVDCTHMWKGISVNGTQQNNTFTFIGNTIKDAYAAIEIKDGSNVQQNSNEFINNYIGVYSAPSSNLKQHFGSPIFNSKFSTKLPMLGAYTGQPAWSQIPFAGIFVSDLDHLIVNKITFPGSFFTLDNNFDGLVNGILAENCSLTSQGTIFQNISSSDNVLFNNNLLVSSKGHSVRVINSPLPININNNSFYNCLGGIKVSGSIFSMIEIDNNEFSYFVNNPIIPKSMITVHNCDNGEIRINNNETLTDYQKGNILTYNINGTNTFEVTNNIIKGNADRAIAIYNVVPSFDSFGKIQNNRISTTERAFSILNSMNLSVVENIINKDFPQGKGGFSIENTHNSHFRDNEMHFGFLSSGFSSSGSSYNLFCCNEMDNPNNAFSFTGQSNPSTLTTNTSTYDTDPATQAFALWLHDAQIGVHNNKGNKWLGVNNKASISTVNDDDVETIATGSTFRTDFGITGLKPAIISPQSIEDLWFIDLNANPPTCATSPSCDVPPYELVPPGNPTGDDACDKFRLHVEALLGPKLAGYFKDQNDWALYYFAYNYLQDIPEEYWEDCTTLDLFMDNVDETIKGVNSIDKSIVRINEFSQAESNQLNNASEVINQSVSDLILIYNSIVTNNGNYNDSQSAILALQQNIYSSSLIINQLSAMIKNNQTGRLNSILTSISNQSTPHLFQSLLLDIWEIKVKISVNGISSITSIDLDVLTNVANSCIMENSQALFEARAILSFYFDQNEFVNLDDACLHTSNREQKEPNAKDLMVYPNPSNGVFNLNLTLEESAIKVLNVINQDGQVIRTINKGRVIDLSNQPSGIYIVQQINLDGEINYQRIILVK